MSVAGRRLAAVAVIALLGVGCSKAPASTGSGTPASPGASSASPATTLAKALLFAKCMRDNGVGDFPDPGPSGQFTIDAVANGSGVDTNSAAFQQAMSACKDLEPSGFTGSARSAQQQVAALKFAQCIRAHGVPDFPDPTSDGPLIDTNRIPSAATAAGMSSLHAGMQQCGSLARAAGVTGGQ